VKDTFELNSTVSEDTVITAVKATVVVTTTVVVAMSSPMFAFGSLLSLLWNLVDTLQFIDIH
jgi:hypothetical protein